MFFGNQLFLCFFVFWQRTLCFLTASVTSTLTEPRPGDRATSHIAAKFDSRVFTFYDDVTMDASEANETCKKSSGFLIRERGPDLQEFIKEVMVEAGLDDNGQLLYWVGMEQDLSDRSKWFWSDGQEVAGSSGNPNW